MTTGLTGISTRRSGEREFTYTKVDDLRPHPLNEQIYGTPELDAQFVESIKVNGVLEPVLYARMSFNAGESYEDYIISGHRRWLAAKQLGFKKIPARDYTAEGARGCRSENIGKMLEIEQVLIETNFQRVKTESQKDAETAALLRIEKKLAAERQKAGVSLNLGEGGKASKKVAIKTGESPTTVEKRAAIHAEGVDPDIRNKQSTEKTFQEVQQERRRKGFKKANPEYADKSNEIVDAAIQEKHGTPTLLRKQKVQSGVQAAVEVPPQLGGSIPTASLQSSVAPTAPASSSVDELTKTFYVIRHKSDGKFFREGAKVGRFLEFDSATHIEDEYREDYDVLQYESDDYNSRKRYKLQPNEWEWVRVEATYQLTALAPVAPLPAEAAPANAIEDDIELLERVLRLDIDKKSFDFNATLKNLIRDRRDAAEIVEALKRGETHFQGRKILGSKIEPYVQRWTREDAEDVLLQRLQEDDNSLPEGEITLKQQLDELIAKKTATPAPAATSAAPTKRGRKSKLNPEDISQIRTLAITTKQKAIAKQFGVSPATISNVLKTAEKAVAA